MNSNIRVLHLKFCNIEHNGLTYILQALRNCPIQELNLVGSNVQVGGSNGSVLREFIIRKPTLETLNFSINPQIGDIGAHKHLNIIIQLEPYAYFIVKSHHVA